MCMSGNQRVERLHAFHPFWLAAAFLSCICKVASCMMEH